MEKGSTDTVVAAAVVVAVVDVRLYLRVRRKRACSRIASSCPYRRGFSVFGASFLLLEAAPPVFDSRAATDRAGGAATGVLPSLGVDCDDARNETDRT